MSLKSHSILTLLKSDPWWIFTTINLFWNIVRRYEFGIIELIRVSPRFAVLLGAMILSMCFIIVDILSVTAVFSSSLPDGINPFWKLAFVFKLLTDTIILDDFKTALDKLKQYKLQRLGIETASATFGSYDANSGNESSGRPTLTRLRKDTVYQPWNESRGVTDNDRPPKNEVKHEEFANIDLEMAYWTPEHGESSRPNESRG
jgi:hypothetical protein